MNLDHRRLRALVRVADELSFSRAAIRLNISQPGLSAQIRAIEGELGFEVFERSTRRVELTTLGREFLKEARRVVAETERLERLVRLMQRQASTQLIVGTAIYTIDFPDRIRLLERLIETSADLAVQVSTGLAQSDLAQELAAGHLDLAIFMGMPVPSSVYQHAVAENAGRESLYDAGLRTAVLRRKRVELLVPAESALAQKQRIRADDLAGQSVAIFHADHGEPLYRPIADYLTESGAQLVVPPEPNAIGVERHGQKFRIPAITLGWFAQTTADPGMLRRDFADLDVETRLVLAGHPDITRPAVERAFAVARALEDSD